MITIKNLGALWRTLRYLKVQQIFARLDYKARCFYYLSPLYPLLENLPQTPDKLILTPAHIWKGDKKIGKEILTNNFTFVGRTVSMGAALQWQPQGVSALWTYNLHYFSWLKDLRAIDNEKAKIHARELIEDWIDNCSDFNKITWHPYPLSLRITSWLTHAEWLLENVDEDYKHKFLQSLIFQIQHLERSLEWDVSGNHLIKNLKAVIYAGLCVPAKQSAYLDAMKLLLKQLALQILPDGAHYELSPHYHVDVLKDLLDIHALVRKAGQTPPPRLSHTIDNMALALKFYTYKDGKLGLFNDGDEGNKKEIADIISRCGIKEKPPLRLENAGYIRIIKGNTLLFFDGAKCCPDNLPAHAHADSLSFELCLGKERIFTNSGTYGYQHKLRNKLRGTAAHNTVLVDGENSAEVWSEFRLGRRPTEIKCEVLEEKNVGIGINSAHNGYHQLGVSHSRKIFIAEDGEDIRGEDIVKNIKGKSKIKHTVVAHFHLHPDVKYSLKSHEEAVLETKSGAKLSLLVSGGRLHDGESNYAPQFGELIPRHQLILRGRWDDGQCLLRWAIKVL